MYTYTVTHLLLDNSYLKNELNIVADGDMTLDTFCEYQQTVNVAGDGNPQHFDYAILITG